MRRTMGFMRKGRRPVRRSKAERSAAGLYEAARREHGVRASVRLVAAGLGITESEVRARVGLPADQDAAEKKY